MVEEEDSCLVVGHDVLADAFGQEVYCRNDDGKIECPGCGEWVLVIDANLKCPSCHLLIDVCKVNSRWWSIMTCQLLYTNTTSTNRFFLPRAWNRTSPWITRETLEAMYVRFSKERYNV